MRCALYARLSKDRARLSVNCDIQLAECRDYVAERGWDVVFEAAENDISASRYSTKPRPLYDRLLGMVRRGEVDVIVATEGERLHRRPDEMSALIDIAERHPLRIALTNDDGYDLTDANGIYRARTGVALAERESRKLSERQRRKKAAQARLGLPQGGRRPFGYEANMMTVNEPEAAVVRLMAELVLRGWGYGEVSRHLNAQGYVTSEGKLFYGVTICNLLKKPRYAGIRTHNGTEYPAAWEAILDKQTWERLQLNMKLRSEKNVPKARKYLLTGLLECGRCGGKLNGSKKIDHAGKPERRIYQCVECRKIRRNADALDWFVRESVLYRLDSPEMAKLLSPRDDGELRSLLAERQVRQTRLDALVEDYATGLLTRTQLLRAKTLAEGLLAETQDALARASSDALGLHLNPGDSIRTAWAENQTDWRRSLIELLVKRIVINPSLKKPLVQVDGVTYRFDAEAIEISWKV